jgi:hypothetical protein
MIGGLVLKSLVGSVANAAKGIAGTKNPFWRAEKIDVGLHAKAGIVHERRTLGKSLENQMLYALISQRIRQFEVKGLDALVAFCVVADVLIDSRSNPIRKVIPTFPPQRNG